MTKAVESGWTKLKIEAAAAQKQAKIDSGSDVIVGVNKYKLQEESLVDVLVIDDDMVRNNQIARPKEIKAKRNQSQGDQALADLTAAAQNNIGNLLDLAVKAIRCLR